MYRVLVVDDERVIREGISVMIDWESLGLSLIGTAENGRRALDIIRTERPDIVITDIKMPEMDGLELIAAVQAEQVNPAFLVLTGYGEFEIAHQAMKYGVKHYLLKPCDENDIIGDLELVITELNQKRRSDQLFREMQDNWDKVLPQVKEQFLTEFIETGKYNHNDCERFRQIFGIVATEGFRILLIQPEASCSLLERFALKNISEELIGSERVPIGALLNGELILLVEAVTHQELEHKLDEIKDAFRRYYGKGLTVAISDESPFDTIPQLYRDAKECIQHAFYLGEGYVITQADIILDGENDEHVRRLEIENIAVSVKIGHISVLEGYLRAFFDRISSSKVRIELAKTYCLELLLHVIRTSDVNELQPYAESVIHIQDMGTLHHIEQYLTTLALDIARGNYERTAYKHGMVVQTVMKCVEEQLASTELSLKWLAKEVLYMNEDYLGRLFQRETNERFSQYLLRLRMEKAKELLRSRNHKILEVSERSGFGGNNQYFSNVFKKYTGISPSEYKSLYEQ
jgi:two-component system response regulator YesN